MGAKVSLVRFLNLMCDLLEWDQIEERKGVNELYVTLLLLRQQTHEGLRKAGGESKLHLGQRRTASICSSRSARGEWAKIGQFFQQETHSERTRRSNRVSRAVSWGLQSIAKRCWWSPSLGRFVHSSRQSQKHQFPPFLAFESKYLELLQEDLVEGFQVISHFRALSEQAED
jgi:hypothetical protein